MIDPRLREAIAAWKAATDAPPEGAQARVRAAIDAELGFAGQRPGRARWWLPAAAAVAASLLLAAAAGWSLGRAEGPVESSTGQLVVAEALATAKRAEREHAEAIANLQDAANLVLARAGQADTPTAETLRLIAYRERLAAIDAAIQDIDSYLRDNPGLSAARTLLLASYIAKTELLREILALHDPEKA